MGRICPTSVLLKIVDIIKGVNPSYPAHQLRVCTGLWPPTGLACTRHNCTLLLSAWRSPASDSRRLRRHSELPEPILRYPVGISMVAQQTSLRSCHSNLPAQVKPPSWMALPHYAWEGLPCCTRANRIKLEPYTFKYGQASLSAGAVQVSPACAHGVWPHLLCSLHQRLG